MRILTVIVLLTCIGCNGGSHHSSKGTPSSALSAAGTQKLMNVTVKYYGLKNALVATDAAKAGAEARALASESAAAANEIKNDNAKYTALKPYFDTIGMYSGAISGSDNNCERQRISFEYVSRAMFMLLKNAEVKNAGIYKQYCPMAFNDKGAYWLSEEEEIKNPYFGKKMLECGEVQDSL